MAAAVHIVQSGDTLESLAQNYFGDEMMWQYLASINHITEPYYLIPGEKIIVDAVEVESSFKLTYITIGLAVIVAIALYFYFRA